MELVAHRACSAQYPENTIRATKFASPHVDRIELDIQRCGSGEVVVFRDDDLTRLAGIDGVVRKLPWDVLREVEVLGSGETIPLLSDFVEATPDDTGLHIELKHSGLVEDVRDIVSDAGNDVIIISGDPDLLAEVNESSWDVGVTLVFYGSDDPMGELETAIDLGCVGIEMHFGDCLGNDFISRAHEAGIELIVGGGGANPHECGVHDPLVISALERLGIEGIMVDTWNINYDRWDVEYTVE